MGYMNEPPVAFSRYAKLSESPLRTIPVWNRAQDEAPYYERWTRFAKGQATDYDPRQHGPDPGAAGFAPKIEMRVFDIGAGVARIISVTSRQLQGWIQLQNAHGCQWDTSVVDITRTGEGFDTRVNWSLVRKLTDAEAARLRAKVELDDWAIAAELGPTPEEAGMAGPVTEAAADAAGVKLPF